MSERTSENFGYKQELKRALTLSDLVIYGLIFMVPIAPFGIYGVVANTSQGMPALVYIIGMVAMIFTAFSYARLSEEFPIAGSVYSYASRGLSDTVGFFSGWIIIMDYFLIPALLIIVSGAAISAIIPDIPIWIWAVVFVSINTFVNIIGVEKTARFNKVVLVLEVAVFLLFMFFALKAVSNGVNGSEFSTKPIFDPEVFNMDIVMAAVSVAVLSYLGFDAISTLGEETTGGSKTVGKATVLSLVIVGFFFITLTWVAGMLWPDYNSFENIDEAFYAVAEAAGGTWLKVVCAVATALAWGIADALVAQAAISRVLFSMSRDGYLPKFLSRVHGNYRTPYTASLVVAAITLVIAVGFSYSIENIASLVNFGALTNFLVLHITVISYFFIRKKSGNLIRDLLLPVIGFLIILYVWISLDKNSKILGFAWIGVGIVYYIILTKVFKKKARILEI